jgi:hypothetical protein
VEDVAQERLIREHGANVTGRIAHEHFEQPEAGPSRRSETRREHFADDRCGLSRPQRRDGQELGAILVAQRKPEKKILDRAQPDAFEVGGAPRTDAADEPERRREPLDRLTG